MKGKSKLKKFNEVEENQSINLQDLTKKELKERYPNAEGKTKKELIKNIEENGVQE